MSQPPSNPSSGSQPEPHSGSASGRASSSPELIVVGRVGSPYGVRGWVRVTSYTDPPSNLNHYEPWHLPSGIFRTLKFKAHQNNFVAQLANVNDRDAAAALAGCDIKIDAAQLVPTQGDEYYWRDLVGLVVRDPLGESQGRVLQLLETGAHDVLVVATQDGQEVLIPFVSKFVQQVDIASKTIVVDWPEFTSDAS